MDTANIIFAIMLPIALMAVPFFAIWTKHRQKLVELQLKSADQVASGAAYEELEERTRILERIITDRGFDVATQIDALRDKPRELDRQR